MDHLWVPWVEGLRRGPRGPADKIVSDQGPRAQEVVMTKVRMISARFGQFGNLS